MSTIILQCIAIIVVWFWSESHMAAYDGDNSRQLLVAVTKDWTSTTGRLYRYGKIGGVWNPVGHGIPIVVGAAGLGWGRGLHQNIQQEDPVKSEGDSRSPAGIFTLGEAFGHVSVPPFSVKMPYRPITATLTCIEDTSSTAYNKLIEPGEIDHQDWSDTEGLFRHYELYKWGLVIQHNSNPPMPGEGSCIFLHVWRNPTTPTGGCVAMAAHDIEIILQWVEPDSQPLYVQVPQHRYRDLQRKWNFPSVPN